MVKPKKSQSLYNQGQNISEILKKEKDIHYNPEALVVYPSIASIPCLRIENGIIASKYPEIIKTH